MFNPVPLNLPYYPIRLKEVNKQIFVLDVLRKKYLRLTPEEWVRQHWIEHLAQTGGYPKSLMQSESGLILHEQKKRSDLVIFNTKGERILLAEFKSPTVKISQNAFDQIARYNIVYKIPLLLISNGLDHFYCKIDFKQKNYTFLKKLPQYTL